METNESQTDDHTETKNNEETDDGYEGDGDSGVAAAAATTTTSRIIISTKELKKERKRKALLKREMTSLKKELYGYRQLDLHVTELENQLASMTDHLTEFDDMIDTLERSETERLELEQKVIQLKYELADLRTGEDWDKLKMQNVIYERDQLKREMMRSRRAISERPGTASQWKASVRRFSVDNFPGFRRHNNKGQHGDQSSTASGADVGNEGSHTKETTSMYGDIGDGDVVNERTCQS
mmetsp:Transcript_11740/g.14596  ORF Transcript_11740/g.14596 Transcript_11740/m.14596 type:complete len:239 (-) Transcript_11740:457-1173(-)|eukprot:CAMPEP_0172511822 /NCGR_PEP_ID=MMETSP1066-20121228/239587_1 /TAXON_ID=671091 /ORGANISM="Coscinodiscus wailesii, Strain CCMP2513" /LENGTH=238 /DNA_ID=CAMNT_0013291375 /DNA_START=26 /DNA_END=742 /DNA_ORIENTATION=+